MDAEKGKAWLAASYAAVIFLGALLLFQVQPLVGKHILPWFGGSPAVWTICLLFFQTLLLAGYAYAHACDRWLRPRQQAVLHMGLLAVAAAMLLAGILPHKPQENLAGLEPARQILSILTASIGLPYFLLSATGPLVQAWFGRVFPGRSPYRLYALSNAGSLIALLSYPFLFERVFDLPLQAQIWSWGFVIFALLCGYIAVKLPRGNSPPQPSPQGGGSRTSYGGPQGGGSRTVYERDAPTERPGLREYLLWLVWPALACIMLMATSNHISTDIAATPFLWVAPLALYLVTLIIAFDRPHWYRPTIVSVLTLAAIYAAGLVHKERVGSISIYDCGTPGWVYQTIVEGVADPNLDGPPVELEFRIGARGFLIANLAAMFGVCLICHGELVRRRPDPRYLTSFYLMVAAGGALGGMLVALVAPAVFSAFFEWELSLFAAALLGVGLLLRSIVNFAFGELDARPRPSQFLVLPPLAIVALLAAAVVLLDVTQFLQPRDAGTVHRLRNFYGALAVRDRDADDRQARNYILRHGAITHGAQFVHPTRRREPTTYFARASGIGRTIDYLKSESPGAGGMNIAVVGLGVGTLAAYVDAGDRVTFYELNPAVVEIAENGAWFTYLRDCRERGGQVAIKLGDARRSLDREQQEGETPNYDLLVLDAFSGDSIPMHLLTAEAFEIYLARISSNGTSTSPTGLRDEGEGAIAVHISNRFVDLEPVLRGAAKRFGLECLRIHNKANRAGAIYSADWIILSRNEALMRQLAKFAREKSASSAHTVLWTDKRSSLFDVLK